MTIRELCDDPRPDEELLSAYQSELDDDGRALTVMYGRYQRQVLAWLKAEGVSSPAEAQVGAVFLRALNRADGQGTLRERLAAEARAVARDPD